MNRLILIVLLVISPVLAVADESQINQLLTQAESLHQQAQKDFHGWAVTPKLITESKQAIEDGNLEKATTLAQRAIRTAAASVSQAEREKKDWQARLPETKP